VRKLTWRLPVLIAAVAAIPAAPAHAADEGEVGVRDRVIRVSARATLPGADVRSGGESDGCTWKLMIENDRLPVYDVDGRQLFSDTGRWFQRVCNGQPVDVNGLFVLPEGGGFSIPDLNEQALDALDPGDPTWSASPNGTTVPMVTQMPTYFWVDPTYWTATRTVRVETPSGRVWAEAVGRQGQPLAVEPAGIGYRYVDPGLDRLNGAQQHLLRMGPANARLVKRQLRELALALGIPASRLPPP
jgi:hypothetical protein